MLKDRTTIFLGLCIIMVLMIPAKQVQAENLKVVTTVAPITNMVYNVGGDKIALHGIIPEGINSHTFEPAPSDAKHLAKADLIIVNGLTLEVPTQKLASKVKKKEAKVLSLGDNTISKKEWRFDFSFPEDEGKPNPHLWPNIAHTMRYVELIRGALEEVAPVNADYYRWRASIYLAKLKVLDEAIFKCVASIPKNTRKLLTYHDSFAYFASRYGMTVIGAVQPSDFSEPSPREIARLIDQIRAEKVPAIFGSNVFPSKVLDQIGRETRAMVVDKLRDDDLPGEIGDPNHTFIGMMVENMENITGALGGDPTCVDGVDVSNIQ
ncbi:MAG: metal ABC transporter substrate-binding protein [Thermodesulfobacteriota bacterium]